MSSRHQRSFSICDAGAPTEDTTLRKFTALRDLYTQKVCSWPWSEAQTWRMIRAGRLPQPFYIEGSRLACLYDDEIDRVVEEAVKVRGKRKAA